MRAIDKRLAKIDLSQPQDTEAGKFLFWLYYQDAEKGLLSLFAKDRKSGSPHNGGYHTLHIRESLPNINAWFALAKEIAPTKHFVGIEALYQKYCAQIVCTPAEQLFVW